MNTPTPDDIERFRSKVNFEGPAVSARLGPCHLWTGGVFKDGYGAFKLQGRAERAHRVAYVIAKGPIGDALARHRCDVRLCVNADHLIPGSVLDNNLDKMKRGRSRAAKGEQLAKSLTEAQVIQIRKMHATGRSTVGALAGMFGVGRRAIYHIVQGTTWTHV